MNMPTTRKPVVILIAEDDADDRQFTREALKPSPGQHCTSW
jgi:hypothetical protein